MVVTSTMRTFFYSFNEIVIATDIKQNNDSNGIARTNTDTSVNIRDAPMQKTTNKIMMIATEWHGLTRTTSVNIRDTPMQKTTNKIVMATKWYRCSRCAIGTS